MAIPYCKSMIIIELHHFLKSTNELYPESVKLVLLRHDFLILRSRISIRSLIIRRPDAKLPNFTGIKFKAMAAARRCSRGELA